MKTGWQGKLGSYLLVTVVSLLIWVWAAGQTREDLQARGGGQAEVSEHVGGIAASGVRLDVSSHLARVSFDPVDEIGEGRHGAQSPPVR